MVLMIEDDRDLHGKAARWHAEIDAPYMDWAAFEAWLSTGPQHRHAYDDIAALDAEIVDRRGAIASLFRETPAAKPVRAPSHRPIRIGVAASMMAAAAAIVAVVTGPLHRTPKPRSVVFATRMNGRDLALADGSRITLDRNTRIAVSAGNAVTVDMTGGTANFRVRHDPNRMLTVRAAGYEIRDIGTVFDVAVLPGHVSVAVAAGQVSVRRSGADAADDTVLAGGQRIDLDAATGIALRSKVPPQSVSAWKQGRLSYDDAPLSVVGADVSRYVDRSLVVDPSAADMRFSGVLTIGDGSRLVDQLKAVLPIDARRVGGVVHLRRTGSR